MKNSKPIVIGLSITGSIIGVGFASGKEIVIFFARYGYLSLLFCLLAGVMFGLFSYVIFSLEVGKTPTEMSCKKRKMSKNKVKNHIRNAKLSNIFNIEGFSTCLIFLCQLAICSAMFAGLGSVLNMLKVNGAVTFIIKVAVLCLSFIYLSSSSFGVYFLNSILSVAMVAVIVILFVLSVCGGDFSQLASGSNYGILYMPILYVGMNVFTALPLMTEVSSSILNKRERVLSSLCIGIIVWLMLSLVCVMLLMFGSQYFDHDMPMLALAGEHGKVWWAIYMVLIVLGVLSTLIATAHGSANALKVRFGYKPSLIINLLFAFLLSFIGFSKIIDRVYPIIGGACLIMLLAKVVFKRRMV